jgi:hypothetical protein
LNSNLLCVYALLFLSTSARGLPVTRSQARGAEIPEVSGTQLGCPLFISSALLFLFPLLSPLLSLFVSQSLSLSHHMLAISGHKRRHRHGIDLEVTATSSTSIQPRGKAVTVQAPREQLQGIRVRPALDSTIQHHSIGPGGEMPHSKGQAVPHIRSRSVPAGQRALWSGPLQILPVVVHCTCCSSNREGLTFRFPAQKRFLLKAPCVLQGIVKFGRGGHWFKSGWA